MRRVRTQMMEYLKYLRRSYRYVIVLMMLVIMTGCAKIQSEHINTEKKIDYTANEMIILIASQRGDINDTYGEGVWSATLSDAVDYTDLFYDDMKVFIENMYIANRYASENDIKLDSKDYETINKAVDMWMDEVANASGRVKNTSRQDATKMYEQYVVASKVMDSLASQDIVEVSDSEARVMTVGIIVTDDMKQAREAYDELSQGADFNQIARKYSQDTTIERQITHEDLPQNVAKVAYELEDGNYTDIIEDSGRCYIIECISSYDEEATAQNKMMLQKQRTLDLIDTKFNTYASDYDTKIDNNTWKSVMMDDSVIVGKGFFDCLKEVE